MREILYPLVMLKEKIKFKFWFVSFKFVQQDQDVRIDDRKDLSRINDCIELFTVENPYYSIEKLHLL